MNSHRERQSSKPPRVSIIINAFNGEEFIRDALDSVIAQRFEDWEVVLWDDQSTDATAETARAYDDERIRYFYSPTHTTLSEARHLAVQQAAGEWLAFLDQDDVWSPGKLEKQVGLIDDDGSEELGLVYGRTRKFDANGPGNDFDHWHEFGALPAGDIFTQLVAVGCFIAVSSSMVRASAYAAVGGIPAEYPVAGDYYLFVAVAERYLARAIDETCCWYRVHDSSMSRSRDVRFQAHRERMQLVRRWESKVGPEISKRVHRVHQTLIALEEALGEGRVVKGMARLFRNGSPMYLLSRPLVRSWRSVRRLLNSKRQADEIPATVRGRNSYS